MKKTLKPLCMLLLAGWAGCQTEKMQVISLDNPKIEKNDSLWVHRDSIAELWFYFYANNGADRFAIRNPSDKPIFIDLKNSFIAVDNYKRDFWSDVSSVNANLTFQQYRSIDLVSENPISGSISRPDRIIMVPPNSVGLIQTKVALRSKPFATDGLKSRNDTVAANWTKKEKKTVIRSFDFDDKTSPSSMRLFLSLCRTEDFKSPLYHDLYFRVSNIMVMDSRQATRSKFPSDYSSGAFTGTEKNERSDKHPYKKSWRYYIPAK
jgi:hypothetical protein